jgi:hypothetical protein
VRLQRPELENSSHLDLSKKHAKGGVDFRYRIGDIRFDGHRAAKDETLKLFSRLASVAGIGIACVGKGCAVKANLRHHPAPGVILPALAVPVKVDAVGTHNC